MPLDVELMEAAQSGESVDTKKETVDSNMEKLKPSHHDDGQLSGIKTTYIFI